MEGHYLASGWLEKHVLRLRRSEWNSTSGWKLRRDSSLVTVSGVVLGCRTPGRLQPWMKIAHWFRTVLGLRRGRRGHQGWHVNVWTAEPQISITCHRWLLSMVNPLMFAAGLIELC
jgi:hypothetical protein